MYTHSKWLPYSPLSLKTCNCSTINDIKHFHWIHEFQSASFAVQHSPKDTDPDSHAQAFCPQHSQREVVIDTSKIKTLPRHLSIHVYVCVNCCCFFIWFADVLRVWSSSFSWSVGLCVCMCERLLSFYVFLDGEVPLDLSLACAYRTSMQSAAYLLA